MHNAIFLAAFLAIFGVVDAHPGLVRREDDSSVLVASGTPMRYGDDGSVVVATGTPIRHDDDSPVLVASGTPVRRGDPAVGTVGDSTSGGDPDNGPYPTPTSNTPASNQAPTAKVMIVDQHDDAEFYFDITGSGWDAKELLEDNLKQCVKVKHFDVESDDFGEIRAYGKVKGSGKGSLSMVEHCFNVAIQQSGGPANSVG